MGGGSVLKPMSYWFENKSNMRLTNSENLIFIDHCKDQMAPLKYGIYRNHVNWSVNQLSHCHYS